MEKIKTVSGTGPVYVDSDSVGHCAYEINVYRDATGRVSGRGHLMGESNLLGKIFQGQRVEIAAGGDGARFSLVAGDWTPGARRIEVETGPEIAR